MTFNQIVLIETLILTQSILWAACEYQSLVISALKSRSICWIRLREEQKKRGKRFRVAPFEALAVWWILTVAEVFFLPKFFDCNWHHLNEKCFRHFSNMFLGEIKAEKKQRRKDTDKRQKWKSITKTETEKKQIWNRNWKK